MDPYDKSLILPNNKDSQKRCTPCRSSKKAPNEKSLLKCQLVGQFACIRENGGNIDGRHGWIKSAQYRNADELCQKKQCKLSSGADRYCDSDDRTVGKKKGHLDQMVLVGSRAHKYCDSNAQVVEGREEPANLVRKHTNIAIYKCPSCGRE